MKWLKTKPKTSVVAKPQFAFAPMISIQPVRDGLNSSSAVYVGFDSNHQFDQARASIVFAMPLPNLSTAQMRFEVIGFADADMQKVGNKQTVKGSIVWSSGLSTGENQVVIPLTFELVGVPTANGDCLFMSGHDIKQIIQQGVSRALTVAWQEYFERQLMTNVTPVAAHAGLSMSAQASGMTIRHQGYVQPTEAGELSAKARKNLLVAMIVGPVLAVIVIWLTFGGQSQQTPYEDALAAALASNPAAVESSVNMTKQALMEMGLDPGGAGDLGCLAPTPQ